VPFHIEIHASGLRAAHAFNLSDGALREQVLAPWGRGELLRLGDRLWDPSKCRLTVLEGPELAPADLSYGQGWNNARKRARDVTASVVAPAQPPAPASAPATANAGAVAVLGASAAMHGYLEALGLRTVDWAVLRAELLALAAVAGPPAAAPPLAANAAVVVLCAGEPPALDLGLALGGLGGRAILTAIGAPPADLAGLTALRLDEGGAAPLHALAQRLRMAGCALAPVDGWDAPERFRR
jgi:hypothetical protein